MTAQTQACEQGDVHVDWRMTPEEWGQLSGVLAAHAGVPYIAALIADGKLPGGATPCPGAVPGRPGGQWLQISFLGYVELVGYVTEVTLGGQPAFHVDLPEKIWGGDPMGWEEYSVAALRSRRPVAEDSVRRAWEARAARDREWARQQAEKTSQLELEAAEAGCGEPSDHRDEDEGAPF